MKDLELDAQLRKTLHESVAGLQADDKLKARIDFMTQGHKTKTGRMWKKVTAGLAAALCLTVVGALASGQFSALQTSLRTEDMRFSAEDLQQDTARVADGIAVPGQLAGYAFQKGAVEYTDKLDDDGNRLSTYPSVAADYGTSINGDGTVLTYTARAYDSELDGPEATPAQSYEGQPRETREIGGVTVSYRADRYLFLPSDEQPTAEEQALADNNELYISYGVDEREQAVYQHISWQAGDVVYGLYTTDTTLSADELFAAAADAIGA